MSRDTLCQKCREHQRTDVVKWKSSQMATWAYWYLCRACADSTIDGFTGVQLALPGLVHPAAPQFERRSINAIAA